MLDLESFVNVYQFIRYLFVGFKKNRSIKDPNVLAETWQVADYRSPLRIVCSWGKTATFPLFRFHGWQYN